TPIMSSRSTLSLLSVGRGDVLARGEGRTLRVLEHRHPYPWGIERRHEHLAAELGRPLGGGIGVVHREGDAPVVRDAVLGRMEGGDRVLEAVGRADALHPLAQPWVAL